MTTKKITPEELDRKEDEEKKLQNSEPQDQAWWESAMFLDPAQDSDR